MTRGTTEYKYTTRFGKWMSDNMHNMGLTQLEVANRLHMTQATVNRHIIGHVKPNYVTVIAYCRVFGNWSDPDEIWGLLED